MLEELNTMPPDQLLRALDAIQQQMLDSGFDPSAVDQEQGYAEDDELLRHDDSNEETNDILQPENLGQTHAAVTGLGADRMLEGGNTMKNRRLYRTNKSGTPGVRRDEKRGRWTAYISAHGRMHRLGDYLTEDEAVAARKAGEAQHWSHDESNQGDAA